MADKTYTDPNITLSKIYTKTGDNGSTNLVNGRRLRKDNPRIAAYGTVDELNAFVGTARVSCEELAAATPALGDLAATLHRVQHELFNLGSLLATDPEHVQPRQPQVTDDDVAALEAEIDRANETLKPARSFVLPGGCRLNTELHVCRTVCRRAERVCVALDVQQGTHAPGLRYLNRLGDAFFVWSRWACQQLAVEESLWDPNRGASA